ncbi:alkylhydroperoxidase [Rhodoplanes roseus]|uniref:Alkylhydroperoxidase n=2 Tax=Rhodoplanes roseus TaxID=29409 RepID=A0A327L4U1_9BRAD|nr:alkylhydroperoxidase [Rhodoplanes roseus]
MWIAHVPYPEATGRLKQLYDRIKGPGDNVDNIMLAHSLRPHTMEGHMTIYKYVLHHTANATPKWFLEAIGVLVSLINGCAYCAEHHFAGLRRLVGDEPRSAGIRAALDARTFAAAFDAAQTAALRYAAALTEAPQDAPRLKACVDAMRAAGLDDGRILEINQVTAYFNYANRTVSGLGVTTDGDILGLSPGNSDNPDDWSHG